MRGITDFNYPAFREASKLLRGAGYYVLDPSSTNPPTGDIRACMAVDLGMICAHAEAVVVLPNWENSTGAKAEVALAEAIGIPVLTFAEALLRG